MHINSLYNVLAKMETFTEETKLANLMAQLHSVTQQVSKSPGSNNQAAYTQALNKIISAHESFEENLSSLEPDEVTAFYKFDFSKLFGKSAIDRLNQDIKSNFGHIASIPGKIQLLQNELNQAIATIKNIKNSLEPFQNEKLAIIEAEHQQFKIVFAGDLEPQNLNDLIYHTRTWNWTLMAFKTSLKTNEDDFKLISAEDGSLIFTLDGIAEVITHFATAVTLVQLAYINMQTIRLNKKALGVTEKGENGFSEEEIDKIAKKVADDLMVELGWNEDESKTENSNYNSALNGCIEFVNGLLKIFDNGGSVQFKSLKNEKDGNASYQIRSNFEKIKTLKSNDESAPLFPLPSRKEDK